jgi:hypothetical protein
LLCMNNISHDRLENIPGRKIKCVFYEIAARKTL